ncbi:MAG: ATP-binding protein [Candidatus Methanoplasma sp.]|jgi:uncharacterized membrane protein YoaK (UPF0700 family)|nr:ATP-binding protein [Candidatus Methanoplasma sp.]
MSGEAKIRRLHKRKIDGKRISRWLYATYVLCTALSLTILVTMGYLGNYVEMLSVAPALFLLVIALICDREFVHIQPLQIYLCMAMIVYIVCEQAFRSDNAVIYALDAAAGVIIGLSGLIIAYVALNSKPGRHNSRPVFSLFLSFMCSMALFSILIAIQYIVIAAGASMEGYAASQYFPTYDETLRALCISGASSLALCVLFYLYSDKSWFRFIVMEYSNNNLWVDGPEESNINLISRALRMGESETVEFKSTLRMNLETGEQDQRMEKAALKTIVGFMNGDGGTLLIGVNDDGEIMGVDRDGFDSSDDMCLYLTDLITKNIGHEFVSLISLAVTDIEGRDVMHVTCGMGDHPVFLREGRERNFYARFGPSTVGLNGQDLLGYVTNRFGRKW